MTGKLVVLCVAGLQILPSALAAQDRPTFGVNFGVLGRQQIGITYHVAPAVTLRPGVTFGWGKNRGPDGQPGSVVLVDYTSTELGLGLDVLFPVAGAEEIVSYVGVGGGASHWWFSAGDQNEGATRWSLNGLFGVRASLMERVAAYGELVAQYSNDGGDYDRQIITVGTTALGVIVYFD